MFLVLNQNGLASRPLVRRTMFLDRARQFVARHRWPLSLDGSGCEVDEFDDEWTTYCVVVEGERHLASARLRPASKGSMVERHFSQFTLSDVERLRTGSEVTRFCTSVTLTAEDRIQAVSDLLLGLCRHCQSSRIPSFFGVVFPAASRVFKLAGWEGLELAKARLNGGVAIMKEWHATELASWEIQEARARREDRLRVARQGQALDHATRYLLTSALEPTEPSGHPPMLAHFKKVA
jgi:acyl homoserine lactone synthase